VVAELRHPLISVAAANGAGECACARSLVPWRSYDTVSNCCRMATHDPPCPSSAARPAAHARRRRVEAQGLVVASRSWHPLAFDFDRHESGAINVSEPRDPSACSHAPSRPAARPRPSRAAGGRVINVLVSALGLTPASLGAQASDAPPPAAENRCARRPLAARTNTSAAAESPPACAPPRRRSRTTTA